MSTPTWVKTPATITIHVTVQDGFPAPDVTAQIDVAGPDLSNPNPSNFVAGTPQTQKAVAAGQTAAFQTIIQNVGYYSIRASATLTNKLGSVTVGPTTTSLGVGQAPSGQFA